MKKSTFDRICAEADRIVDMMHDQNISTEYLEQVLAEFCGMNKKVKAPKKKVRRGIGSY